MRASKILIGRQGLEGLEGLMEVFVHSDRLLLNDSFVSSTSSLRKGDNNREKWEEQLGQGSNIE